jgi:hypothetical protein
MMTCTLVINQPHVGEGVAVYIHGLGTFSNGEHEVSDEQEENFRVANSVDNGAVDGDSESPTFGSYIPKMEPGPPLSEVVKSMYGVTIKGEQELAPANVKDEEEIK